MSKIIRIIIIITLVLLLLMSFGCATSSNSNGDTNSAVEPTNPAISVTIDRVGVNDDCDPLLKGDGEIYAYVVATDGITTKKSRIPSADYYSLSDNEFTEVGSSIFTTNEVGEYLRLFVICYEDDGGGFEPIVIDALDEVLLTYASEQVGVSTGVLSSLFSDELDGLINSFLGTEDDEVGIYEKTWDEDTTWGVGQYDDVASDNLRLWFTIEEE